MWRWLVDSMARWWDRHFKPPPGWEQWPPMNAELGYEDVTSVAAILRAIAVSMPRGATLEIIHPLSPEIEAYVATHAVEAYKHRYRLIHEGTTVAELARIAARQPRDRICIWLFLYDGERSLVEAHERDGTYEEVYVSAQLPEARRRAFLEVLGDPQPIEPSAD